MKIGTVKLGDYPKIVLIPKEESFESDLFKARSLKLDLIELRVDLLRHSNPKELLDKVADFGFYAILTVRAPFEGGNFKGSEEERILLLKELSLHPAVGAVDIELRAEAFKEVVEHVLSLGKLPIVSYHDFERTLPFKQIRSLIDKVPERAVPKLAFMAESVFDAAELACAVKASQRKAVFMSMGRFGSFTRIVGFAFGSLLSYTFFGKPVAPGQLDAETLIKLMKEFSILRRRF